MTRLSLLLLLLLLLLLQLQGDGGFVVHGKPRPFAEAMAQHFKLCIPFLRFLGNRQGFSIFPSAFRPFGLESIKPPGVLLRLLLPVSWRMFFFAKDCFISLA